MVLPTAQRSLFVAPDFGVDDKESEKSESIKPACGSRIQRTSTQRRRNRFWKRLWNYGLQKNSIAEEDVPKSDEASIAATVTEPIKIQTRWLP